MVSRMLRLLPDPRSARVLSLGCGIGDTEILLAPHVRELYGVDLSPAANPASPRRRRPRTERHQRAVHRRLRLDSASGQFDLVIGIFFLHHLSDTMLAAAPSQIVTASWLRGGQIYALDPNRYRLSGAIGSLLIPSLMRKYQTEDERELDPRRTAALFRSAGFDCRVGYYDFVSSPLAGLFPGWRAGYTAARRADNLITAIPLLQRAGSNFELVASLPPAAVKA